MVRVNINPTSLLIRRPLVADQYHHSSFSLQTRYKSDTSEAYGGSDIIPLESTPVSSWEEIRTEVVENRTPASSWEEIRTEAVENRTPAKPEEEVSHEESIPALSDGSEPGTKGLTFNGKYLSFDEYRRLLEEDRYTALEQTLLSLQSSENAVRTMDNILEEAINHITEVRFGQEESAGTYSKSKLNRCKKHYQILLDEFEKVRERLGYPTPRIRGLVSDGRHMPWALYMMEPKIAQDAIIKETWLYHNGSEMLLGELNIRSIYMARILSAISDEVHQYVRYTSTFPQAKKVQKRVWKTQAMVHIRFRKLADKTKQEMFFEYLRLRGLKPGPILEPDHIVLPWLPVDLDLLQSESKRRILGFQITK